MKLLIIDDEELTRKGLLKAIDWGAMGIHEIYEAEDGLEGLEMARRKQPQIILSDIRMPRLNGIAMAKKLQEFLPDCSLILMSGYSDREYLKAAIRLKAVRFVEKPIDSLEIEEAIHIAIEDNHRLSSTRQSEALHKLAKEGQLALYMTLAPEQRPELTPELTAPVTTAIRPAMYFTTMIIKYTGSLDDIKDTILPEIHRDFSNFLSYRHMSCLYVIKHDQYLVYHLFGERQPEERGVSQAGEYLKQRFAEMPPFFIAIGDTVHHIEQVYKSYNSAVILLQNGFFCGYGCILMNKADSPAASPAFSDPAPAFSEALLSMNQERITQSLENIYGMLCQSTSLMPNQVKDVYYKLFVTIQNTYRKLAIHSEQSFALNNTILEDIQNCYTLLELQSLLEKKAALLVDSVHNQVPEHPTIHLIKDFISKNYQWESLSVKEISDHVHMTASYICTLFKHETGLTLNQYITSYRIEKAKSLLADSNNKITEISSRVGYADGNYFGKCFKKQVGLSPSEYREQMLL